MWKLKILILSFLSFWLTLGSEVIVSKSYFTIECYAILLCRHWAILTVSFNCHLDLTQPKMNREESLSEVLSALGWPVVLYMCDYLN